LHQPTGCTLFPYTTLFRSEVSTGNGERVDSLNDPHGMSGCPVWRIGASGRLAKDWTPELCSLIGIVTEWRTDSEVLVATSASKRSEEHTSELQSPDHLVCR